MQQVCPPLAEIPVGDLACVDDRPEDRGLACGQLAEDLSALLHEAIDPGEGGGSWS